MNEIPSLASRWRPFKNVHAKFYENYSRYDKIMKYKKQLLRDLVMTSSQITDELEFH